MAEVNVTRTRLSQIAGSKSPAGSLNRVRVAVLTMAAAYLAPANGDTAGTGIVLPKGSRLLAPFVSNAAGNASSTLSVGIRNPVTKVAIDATAAVNALAISSAGAAYVATGTKVINGQDYVLDQDAELYLTFGGAAGLANQQIRVEVPFVIG
jgi:hypothetical protein